ncbi:MAG: DUF1641 domain-containing protein [Vicinamibacterales bacterium]
MNAHDMHPAASAGAGQAPAVSLDTLHAQVASMAEVIDALRPVVALIHQAPAMLAMAGDSVDELVRTAAGRGVDVERGLINGAGAALRFGASMDARKVDALEALLNSGVLDPAALRIVGAVGQALADAAAAPAPPLGPMGLWRALGQPDVQRALGFLMAVAQRVGAQLDAAPARA